MKNAFKSFGLIALAFMLAFTMAVVGCSNPAGGNSNSGNGNTNTGDDPNTGGNNPGGTNTFPSPKGKITVNGLSSFEGKYIMGTGSVNDNAILLIGYTVSNMATDPTYNLAKITNGKAEVPLYRIEVSGMTSSYIAYDGNDSVYGFSLTIFDSAKMSPMELVYASALDQMDIMEGRFSNGNMTVNWGGEGGDDTPGGNTPTEKPFEYPASSINSAEIERIAAYLSGQSGGTSASNPVNLAVNLQLSEANWWAVLDAIGKAGKYVNLDLSACTRSDSNYGLNSDGKFDNYTVINTDSGKGKIVSLTLPNTAVSFSSSGSSYSFSQLASISGASITSIGFQAFWGCASLTSAIFPNVTFIDDYAFMGCTGLTSITSESFPKATSIGNKAFAGCASLTSVSFPNVTSIGDSAFSSEVVNGIVGNSCISLISVDFPAAISIDGAAFYNCTSLTSVSLPNVTSIGACAFQDCTSLTSVSFPNVTFIDNYAFYRCSSLSTVDIPEGTDYVWTAFNGCQWRPNW